MKQGLKISVRGIVQGVGFRPFIFNLAESYHLTGWVNNTSSGVHIEVNGQPDDLQAFAAAILTQAPPLARIDSFEQESCAPNSYTQFEIRSSEPQPGEFIPISPDVAVCPDCRRELFDPSDRRYHYPFINCTNCGPRFTIIRDIPYDRPFTTMAGFDLCPECAEEYHNPRDRRFHAQPVACPVCGPRVWLESFSGLLAENDEAIQQARGLLKKGKILAIKGLGGFHLACDAANSAAVSELRRRKKRSDKPFALMAFDLAAVERYCIIQPEERQALLSRQSPVVLLQQRHDISLAVNELAPHLSNLGFMLAYTPLHLLLLEPREGFPDVLVMTSGNLSEEPIAYEDQDAHQRLSGVADAFLLHNRPIHTRVDDSVVTAFQGSLYPVRRARGYAPDPIQLPVAVPPILAAGPELKNTFCLTRDRYAFLSHHVGDLENLETLRSYEEGIQNFERIFRIQPELIACDMHPNYLSTRYAQQRAAAQSIPLLAVQHHHAHLAACLADNGWSSAEPVIGLCFDGTGYGSDGAIWGGEVFFGGYQSYQRMAHLAYTPLPGGDLAVHKPARMALAHLWQAGLDWLTELPPVQFLCADERTMLKSQLVHHINTPNTSSMGRLFDAASALMGIRQQATYEGQAAIEMEAAADLYETGTYPFPLQDGILDPAPLWQALMEDWFNRVPVPTLAARFHNSVAAASTASCQAVRQVTGCSTVALSGGVWQNRFLLQRSLAQLEAAGFKVFIHHQVPTNDGGVSLGQALIAAFSTSK